MTLIVNELRTLNGLSNSYWVCGADRRITFEGRICPNRKKIFPIRYLNATVSYFGLAVWYLGTGENKKEVCLSDILLLFITKNSDCGTLDEFANRLRSHLNNKVPSILLATEISGLHICGFNSQGYPHFLHISNVGRMEGFEYLDLQNHYKAPYADFLERDARTSFNWDGTDPLSARNGGYIYRNGDISTHVVASDKFDLMMKEIFKLPNFTQRDNHKTIAEYVKYKFNFISTLYEKWTTPNAKIIGKPIDIYVLTPTGILVEINKEWKELT